MWPFSKREWCCGLFGDAVRNAGERGRSIQIVRPTGSLPMGFMLMFRAVSESDERQFGQPPHLWPCDVLFHTSQGITFCPWCGQNLRQFYRDRTDLPFVELEPPGEPYSKLP